MQANGSQVLFNHRNRVLCIVLFVFITYLGTRIVITGASSGIGENLAKAYAAKGAKLFLIARTQKLLEKVCADCDAAAKNNGFNDTKAAYFAADVTKPEDCYAAAKECDKVLGGVDILILNAGISMDLTFDEIENLEEARKVYGSMMDVNFFGSVNMTKVFSSQLAQSKGQVVVVSTGSGVLGLPRRTGYVASKHALHGFFNSLRNEWKEKGVTVSIVCPGFVKTNIRAHSVEGGRAREAFDPERNMMSAEV